jgi:2-dehydropantoate 2-reductase
LLLCVRAPDLPALAPDLGRICPSGVVSFQNGVQAEALLAGYLSRVVGAVWRQTCTRVSDSHVRFTGPARVVLGLHPNGCDAGVDELATNLRSAGFDVGISERIGEDKWLKLCVNLMSTPNALVQRGDHTTEAFVEIKVRLLREAREVLGAEGISARSCDGRDRSLDAEILHQGESLARGTSARRLPIYNQVWASLRHGAPPEADAYHRLVIDLGRRHGVATPTNERVLHSLEEARRRGSGPEAVSAAGLLG